MERIKIDDLIMDIKRSSRRGTIELTVERDGHIVIYAPQEASDATLESRVREKLLWIHRKVGQKEEEFHQLPQKEFVSGEGFYYLGRKYRLKLLDGKDGFKSGSLLRLNNGWFFMPRDLAPEGRNIFIKWYTKHATDWILRRVKMLKARVATEPQSIEVRDLGFRWGSCTQKGKMFFHWRIILLPPERIDYLILNELLHLHEYNHSPAFYERLRRAAPEYEHQEEWLRRNGDLYSL